MSEACDVSSPTPTSEELGGVMGQDATFPLKAFLALSKRSLDACSVVSKGWSTDPHESK